jgi:hypothetical protein
MRTKLRLLAAAFLLAAVPAHADDLLDAVLWDGPSAFPSKSAPAAPVPPPAAPPAPPAYSAPAVPAAFHAPALATPASAIPSVPAATAAAPDAAAPDADISPETELQLRRELQAMRERTERMETALRQLPPEKLPPWRDPSFSLSGRAGAGTENEARKFSGEMNVRLGHSLFDLSLRGSVLLQTETRTGSYKEPYYTYTYYHTRRGTRTVSHRHTRTVYYEYDVDQTHWSGEFQLIMRPLRGKLFSPYTGIGGKVERLTGLEGADDGDDHVENFSFVGRVGVVLTEPFFERISLKGEFLGSAESYEGFGELSIPLSDHFVLTAYVEGFYSDLGTSAAFGGGCALVF